MTTNTYVLMHGGLKLTEEKAKDLGLDPKKTLQAPQGSELELEEAWVKQVDPSGVQFVTKETYAALVKRVEAQDEAEAAITKKRQEIETAAQKLAAARVSGKLLMAVRAIEAAKKAPKPAKVDNRRDVDELDGEDKKAAKKAPKPAKGG